MFSLHAYIGMAAILVNRPLQFQHIFNAPLTKAPHEVWEQILSFKIDPFSERLSAQERATMIIKLSPL